MKTPKYTSFNYALAYACVGFLASIYLFSLYRYPKTTLAYTAKAGVFALVGYAANRSGQK